MANYLRIDRTDGTVKEVAGLAVSAGAGDAGKIPQLDGTGRLDASMMPVGIGADTQSITASEALAAGDLVNVHNSTGAKVRKADATAAGKHAVGFVLASVANAALATVYFEGTVTGLTGLTGGDQFLAITPGASDETPPNAAGNVIQRVGSATSATTLAFEGGMPIVLV